MQKEIYISFYAEKVLSEQLACEARQRGVNRSELLRYILRLFFDPCVVTCAHRKVVKCQSSNKESGPEC
jgi:hypothetical protein